MATYLDLGIARIGLFSADSNPGPNNEVRVSVDPDMVVIGGGAVGDDQIGKMLTASFPSPDLKTWIVRAKDHMNSDPTAVTGYAIGLRIQDSNGSVDLTRYLHLTSATSRLVSHPDAFAPVWPNCVLLGGGFEVNWAGAGSLATASFPTFDESNQPLGWLARAKDHEVKSPACITTYAVCMEQVVTLDDGTPQGKRFSVSPTSKHDLSVAQAHPAQSALLNNAKEPGNQYLMTGGGGDAQWEVTNGAGSLLWKLQPVFEPGNINSQRFDAASKDHDIPDPVSIVVWVLGINLVPF
jgi:hypothetical protein